MSKRLGNILRGAVEKITYRIVHEEDIADLLDELKIRFVECDIAYDLADKITFELEEALKGQRIRRFGSNFEGLVAETLKSVLLKSIYVEQFDIVGKIIERSRTKDTTTIMFVGINGSGKTTTIAKFAYLLKEKKLTTVLACSDTFRAGAIEQLEKHAETLKIKMVKRPYGSDPASVAYDAVNHATSHGLDVVLIDTAGRMQTKKNLMDELSKVKRVAQPQFTIFVGDALSGNDALDQARVFNSSVGFDAAILAKFDADAKGGAALSIIYETRKPVIYVGTGQGYRDLQPFSLSDYVSSLVSHVTS
ncbi:MAG: signal recognition particle-docking protein FtsY [Thermoproteota archaeon]